MNGEKNRFKGSTMIPATAVFTLLGSVIVLFVVAPLLGLIFTSTFGGVSDAAADEEVLASIRLTLVCSLAAVVVCAVFGIPLAYLLARKRFWGRSLLLALIDLPIIVPHTTAGIALLTVVGRDSIVGATFGSLVGTAAGISAAMAFVSVPFLITSARAGFEGVPPRLENAARTLGASPIKMFYSVSLPLARRDIISGMVMMWARGISEFGAVVIIAYHPMTTPTLVFDRFNSHGLEHARSAAVVLLAVCVVLFAALRFLNTRKKGTSRD